MNMEFNKAFAAVLVAGIIAMACGFVSERLVHPHYLEQKAYVVAIAEDTGAAAGAAVAATAEPIGDLMATADVAHGEKMAKVCATCHTFNSGGANKVGPNIAGIVGKASAQAAGFAYSDAMKNKGGNWDYDALNAFLWNPKKAVPGTKMTFAGLKKPEDRAALIKWLEGQK